MNKQYKNTAKKTPSQAQGGLVIWMTGLSGSGKTTIATKIVDWLVDNKQLTYWIDGDKIRQELNEDLGFSDGDRKENVRRVAHVAKMFKDIGYIVIVSVISPHASMRRFARNLIGTQSLIEVYIKASVEVCQKRDPKGYYSKAITQELDQFTGISSIYEPPDTPDLTLDTNEERVEISCKNIMLFINKLLNKNFTLFV